MIPALIGICGLFFAPDYDVRIIQGWMYNHHFENIEIKREYTKQDKNGYREYIVSGTNNLECDRKQIFKFRHLMYFQIEELYCPDVPTD